MSIIGGFNASLIPIINRIIPLFVLYFMFQLSEIIRDKLRGNYDKEMRFLVKVGREQFIKVQDVVKEGKISLHHDVKHENDSIVEMLSNLKENDEQLDVIRGSKAIIEEHMQVLRDN